jgi:hypothetical protein
MSTLQRPAGRARTWMRRLVTFAAGVLAIGGLAVPAALASPGDLAFADCAGLLPDCVPVSPYNAVEGADAVAVTPDGGQLYVASWYSGTVSHFIIGRAGDLAFDGCIGELAGCTPIDVPAAMVGADALAVTPAGTDLYAAATSGSAVVHFLINGSGDLGYDGCIGSEPGCTAITQGTLAGVDALAVTPDGRDLYAATHDNSAIYHFLINGYGDLGYDGCIENPLQGCTVISPSARLTVPTAC